MRGCVCNTLTILPNELTHTQTNTHFFIPYLKELWCQHKQSLNKASKHNFGLKLKVTFCDVYIDSYVHLLLYSPPAPPPPPSFSSLSSLAAEQLFQKSFFHFHHLQEARRAQNSPSSPGFSLSPHFSCAFFPWVTLAVTVFISAVSFTHIHLTTNTMSKTTPWSYSFP